MKNMKKLLWAVAAPVALVVAISVSIMGLLTQKMGCGGGFGFGGGGGGTGSGSSDSTPPLAPATMTPPSPGPLEITVDDNKYSIDGVEVESIDELVRRAAAVPEQVPPPRVRIRLLGTSRYLATQRLEDALKQAKIDFSE